MKRRILIYLCFIISSNSIAQDKVKLFEPKIFKDLPNVRDISISADISEIYFTIDDYKYRFGAIACIEKKRNEWSEPKIVSFSGNYRDIEPFLSPDGRRLFFSSNRPLINGENPKDYDIWYVERKNRKSKWSSPINLGAPINTTGDEFYPSLTLKGDIYFTSAGEGSKGKEDIFVSRLENGKYSNPKSINGGVNSSGYEFNAYVSPDEKFILFTSIRKGEGSGRGDLYMCLKDINDEWGEAKILSQLSSNTLDYCPFVDINNNKLYFTSTRSEIKNHYKDKLDINDIKRMYNREPSGKSRLYITDFNMINFKNK